MPRKIPHRPAPLPWQDVNKMADMCRDMPTGTVLAHGAIAVFVKVDGGVEARFCDGQVKFMGESGAEM